MVELVLVPFDNDSRNPPDHSKAPVCVGRIRARAGWGRERREKGAARPPPRRVVCWCQSEQRREKPVLNIWSTEFSPVAYYIVVLILSLSRLPSEPKETRTKAKRERERFDIIPPALATHPPAHPKKRDLCIDVFHVSTLPQRIATQQSSYRGARHVKPAQHCSDRSSSFLPARPAQRPPGETTTRLFSGPHPKRFWTLLGSLF